MTTTTPTESEIVETGIATTPATPSNIGIFGTNDPAEVLERAIAVAKPLAKFIEDRKLYKQIGQGRHVYIEGWTLLASMLGLSAVQVWSKHAGDANGEWAEPKFRLEERRRNDGSTFEKRVVEKPGKGGWVSRVEVRRLDGALVSAAEAETRWSEAKWESRDSHQVLSMSQTRASSKALKTALNFIMELAGFNPTPAEEMESIGDDAERSERNETTTDNQCPECGSPVNDHLEEHANESKHPAWKCSSAKCPGGKKKDGGGTWGWASWSPSEFDRPWRPRILDLIQQRIAGYDDETKASDLADEALKTLDMVWDDLDAYSPADAAPIANEIFIAAKNLASSAEPADDKAAVKAEEARLQAEIDALEDEKAGKA